MRQKYVARHRTDIARGYSWVIMIRHEDGSETPARTTEGVLAYTAQAHALAAIQHILISGGAEVSA